MSVFPATLLGLTEVVLSPYKPCLTCSCDDLRIESFYKYHIMSNIEERGSHQMAVRIKMLENLHEDSYLHSFESGLYLAY